MFLIIDVRLSLAAHLASLRQSEWTSGGGPSLTTFVSGKRA